jgi:hypothetical protein
VVPQNPLDAAGLAALAARVLPRLAGHDLALAVVPVDGPGVEVPLRGGGGARAWWRSRRD